MKQYFLALFLLVNAAPLFANDEGGDGPYIPNYQELVREGYGPGGAMSGGMYAVQAPIKSAPKPTQAYYGKGFTVYYGYKPVPVKIGEASLVYAFGYPVDYFRQMMPVSMTETNLNRYAVQTSTINSIYGPGDFVAKAKEARSNAVTTVQTTKKTTTSNGTAPLPAIGEKPAH